MSTETSTNATFEVSPLTAATWPAFDDLVQRHNGIFGGCWCIWFHPDGPERGQGAEANRELKKQYVEAGTAHAALVMDGEVAIAWAEYGTPTELPTLHHRKQYDAEKDSDPDCRITCVFVDRRYRRRGITEIAIRGALDLIEQAGGGVVEAYPHDLTLQTKKMSSSFLYNGTRQLYERLGFSYVRPKGLKNCVMSIEVPAPVTPLPVRGDGQLTPGSEAMSTSTAPVSPVGSANMDMLKGDEIAEARLSDWRKLAQGLHARYLVADFGTGARFVASVGEAGDALGHYPRVTIGNGYVDLKLVTLDAIYRDDEGTEHVVEWVTQKDVDLARRISEVAADHKVDADPASVSVVELGLDTAHSATIAPVWAALLTGNAESQGYGSPSDEIRDATGRVPNLWFGDGDEQGSPRQQFHVEVYVAPEVAEQRIAAAVAAGGTVIDDSDAPSLTVIGDQDGNRGVLCVAQPPAKKD